VTPEFEGVRVRFNGDTRTVIGGPFAETKELEAGFWLNVADRGPGNPFTAELTRRLWLESPTTLVVELTRAGVPGGPASTTRSTYRKG
jgi:hypothetical protein